MPLFFSVIREGSLVSDPHIWSSCPPVGNDWIAAFSLFTDLPLQAPLFFPHSNNQHMETRRWMIIKVQTCNFVSEHLFKFLGIHISTLKLWYYMFSQTNFMLLEEVISIMWKCMRFNLRSDSFSDYVGRRFYWDIRLRLLSEVLDADMSWAMILCLKNLPLYILRQKKQPCQLLLVVCFALSRSWIDTMSKQAKLQNNGENQFFPALLLRKHFMQIFTKVGSAFLNKKVKIRQVARTHWRKYGIKVCVESTTEMSERTEWKQLTDKNLWKYTGQDHWRNITSTYKAKPLVCEKDAIEFGECKQKVYRLSTKWRLHFH